MMLLTTDEQSHVENGGRVFVIEEIPGPLWRVVCVSKGRGARVLLKPDGAAGYGSKETAAEHAMSIAGLSDDEPLIRDWR